MALEDVDRSVPSWLPEWAADLTIRELFRKDLDRRLPLAEPVERWRWWCTLSRLVGLHRDQAQRFPIAAHEAGRLWGDRIAEARKLVMGAHKLIRDNVAATDFGDEESGMPYHAAVAMLDQIQRELAGLRDELHSGLPEDEPGIAYVVEDRVDLNDAMATYIARQRELRATTGWRDAAEAEADLAAMMHARVGAGEAVRA